MSMISELTFRRFSGCTKLYICTNAAICCISNIIKTEIRTHMLKNVPYTRKQRKSDWLQTSAIKMETKKKTKHCRATYKVDMFA